MELDILLGKNGISFFVRFLYYVIYEGKAIGSIFARCIPLDLSLYVLLASGISAACSLFKIECEMDCFSSHQF